MVSPITADAVTENFKPMEVRPKNTTNSCTSSGVLRITSTYTATSARSHAEREVLPTAHSVPRRKPRIVARTDSSAVINAPSISMGQYCPRKRKSKS
ncbi:hypothetical protein G6F65_023322 [Rhizopus arrhizus]|nr:hypothetical protein G6F65_023322 [Rhizopus arrhizus]